MALDFAKEQQIDLGPLFPFESLEEGECLFSQVYQEKFGLTQG